MRSISRLGLPGLLCLALVACSAEVDGAPQGGEPASAPEEPAVAVDPLAVTETGVGPITAETRFDAAALQALFPGAEVEAAYLTTAGQTVPILAVAAPEPGALTVFAAEDGTVGRVSVQAGPYRGPNGATLGAAWPELGLTASDCVMGEGEFAGNPVCRRADSPNVAYVLAVPRWRGQDLPDATTLNGRATLAALVWTSGR